MFLITDLIYFFVVENHLIHIGIWLAVFDFRRRNEGLILSTVLLAYNVAERVNLLLNSFDYVPQETRPLERDRCEDNIKM
jgi:hypothetical protein